MSRPPCQSFAIILLIAACLTIMFGLMPSRAQGAATQAAAGGAQVAVPVTALVPSSAAALIGVDSKWLWNATATIRTQKPIEPQISEIQAILNVSADTDVVPWIGRTYVAVLAATKPADRPVFFAEIRDPALYNAAIARMQTNLLERPMVAISRSKYDGQDVASVGLGGGGPGFQFAAYGGWVIASPSTAAFDKVLDVATGKAPNLTVNAAFTGPLGKIDSSHAVLWGVFSPPLLRHRDDSVGAPESSATSRAAAPGTLSDSIATVNSPAPSGANSPADTAPPTSTLRSMLADDVTAFTIADNGNGARADIVTRYNDPQILGLINAVTISAVPITGDALNHIPNSATACLLVASPKVWLDRLQPMIAQTNPAKGSMAAGLLAMLSPFGGVIDQFTGEAAVSMISQNGKFGILGAFGADSVANAGKALDSFTAATQAMSIPLEQDGDMMTISGIDSPPTFPVSPSFRIDKSYFQATSASDWFDLMEGTPSLTLPSDADGSVAASVGKLTFTDNMISDIEKNTPPDSKPAHMMAVLRAAGVPAGDWSSWTKIDPATDLVDTTINLDHVDWKAILVGMFTNR